jgi:photosystem II stability/assembly factor-like uncharacterized protein
MKLLFRRQFLLASLYVVWLLPLSFGSAFANPSNFAMMMPGAEQSLLLDVAVAGPRLVAVGERGHILYSEDSGASWTQSRVPTNVMLTRVVFSSADLGWAVGHDGNILLSTDGGINWTLQRHGVSAQALINEERAGRAKHNVEALREQLTAVETEEQKVDLMVALEEAQYQLDSARAALDDAVFAPPLMDVWFANEQQGWASGAYGTLLYTSNGGEQWLDYSHKVDNPDQLHLNGVVGAADGSLYLASEWGTVFRSNNVGESWQALETGYEGSFFGVLVNPQTQTVFAYGLRGTVYRSTDKGESWSELQSKARASLFGGDAAPDGSVIFVGSGGAAVLSVDDGNSFTALQGERIGAYGVARLEDGRYIVSGEGGSRVLDASGSSRSGQAASSQESQQ